MKERGEHHIALLYWLPLRSETRAQKVMVAELWLFWFGQRSREKD
jgi:hypothetical protein